MKRKGFLVMDFITSDGIRLNYQKYGEGDPIVFVHGFSGNQAIWTEQIDYFTNQGFQVITYDQRNHGISQKDPNLKDVDVLVLDLKELIQGLCEQKAILVGHSMGAAIGYGFAAKNAELISHFIAIDESPKMIEDDEWHYGFMHATRADYRQKIMQLPHLKQTLHGVTSKVRNAVKNVQHEFPFDWDLNQRLLIDHARRDWRPELSSLRVPTLLMTAAESPFYDGEYAKIMQKTDPNYLNSVTIEQTGHCIMAEQPVEFNEIVLDFIK